MLPPHRPFREKPAPKPTVKKRIRARVAVGDATEAQTRPALKARLIVLACPSEPAVSATN